LEPDVVDAGLDVAPGVAAVEMKSMVSMRAGRSMSTVWVEAPT
jgi:hypothetical protein